MKSKADRRNPKSPSREELLRSCAEQFLVRVKRKMEDSQDPIPPGCYTSKELAKVWEIHPASALARLRTMKAEKVLLRRFNRLRMMILPVPYYKIG